MLNDEIRELLDKVSSQTRRNYNTLLRELNLHVGQDNLLCQLWRKDGLTQVELCERLNCEASTVTNMLKVLEKNGLVVRLKDPADKRINRIFLTDDGKNIQTSVSEVWENQQNRLLNGIPLEERQLMKRLLMQMETNIFS